jgi:RNA 3'-terminal phosphate cyclase (ATP)
MGLFAHMELVRWGFYPAGGGEIQVQVAGRRETLNSIVLTERGELQRVWGTAAVTNLPAHIPQRMAARAHNVLAEAGLQAQVKPLRLRGAGPGAGIFLFAEYASSPGGQVTTAGFTTYGRKGLPAERVAEAACQSLLDHHRSGAPVDPYLADQLVLPMALAACETSTHESRIATSCLSQHLLTNVWVVRQFMPHVLHIEEAEQPRLHATGGSSPAGKERTGRKEA